MFLNRHCLSSLITILMSLSLSSCLDSYRQEPLGYHVVSFKRNHHSPNSAQLFDSRRSRFDRAKIVNVDDFGAKANGRDDSQAFKKAWNYACSSSSPGGAILLVPEKKIYHLKPIDFSGPCKAALALKIKGTIKASVNHSDYQKDRRRWLYFDNVQNLRVGGGGIINGNGRKWWQRSCKINKALPCKGAPTAVTFNGCSNLRVAGLRIKNAQQMHLTFRKCVNVNALNLFVIAPGNSPNTDGIHVTETQNININNCVIRTGDDCISIVSGSKNVRATDITCGPGHGISIGSLGAGNSAAYVSNVFVNNATLFGTTNGVRIKTWQGGLGYARNIKFQNIVMHNVSNPIIIDQNYCDQQKPCPKQGSAVRVSNVVYKNIRGTSASGVAMKFDCSESLPCRGISLQDIGLRPQQQQQQQQSPGEKEENTAKASCANVRFSYRRNVSPPCSS